MTTSTMIPSTTATATSSTSHQQYHHQPIQQYISLLQSQKSNPNPSYIHSIILKCLSDPNVYVGFNEITTLPFIQSCLLNNESSSSSSSSSIKNGQVLWNTLELFSYGTFLDYKNKKGQEDSSTGNNNNNNNNNKYYIKLNDVQEMKLKVLTVVSVVQNILDGKKNHYFYDESSSSSTTTTTTASSSSLKSTNRRGSHNRRNGITTTSSSTKNTNNHSNNNMMKKYNIVPYITLQKALGITNNDHDHNRQLEDILIKCIYSNLLPNGTKLDQKNKCLIIQYSMNHGSTTTTLTNSSSSTTNTNANNSTESNNNNNILCRDINVHADVPDMISKLSFIYNRGEKVKQYLNNALVDLNQELINDDKKWRNIDERIQLMKSHSNNHGVGGRGLNNASLEEEQRMMMVDHLETGNRQFKRSRGGRKG